MNYDLQGPAVDKPGEPTTRVSLSLVSVQPYNEPIPFVGGYKVVVCFQE